MMEVPHRDLDVFCFVLQVCQMLFRFPETVTVWDNATAAYQWAEEESGLVLGLIRICATRRHCM